MNKAKIFILLLLGLVLYVPNTTYAANDYDVTTYAAGTAATHTHSNYYVTQYNSSQHWDHCTFCGANFNYSGHSYAVGWTGTDFSLKPCSAYYPVKTHTCTKCGYKYNDARQAHAHISAVMQQPSNYRHYQYCTDCGCWTSSGVCSDAAGNLLHCGGHTGKCKTCGYNYTNVSQHGAITVAVTNRHTTNGQTLTNTVKCERCGTSFGTVTSRVDKISATRFKVTATANLTYNTTGPPTPGAWIWPSHGKTTLISSSYSGKTSTVSYYVDFDPGYLLYEDHYLNSNFPANVPSTYSKSVIGYVISRTDFDPPAYQSCNITYGNASNGLNTKCTAAIKYTEASSQCQIRVLDSNKSTVLLDWVNATKSGNTYSITTTIPVETGTSKTIYLQARDHPGNVSGYQGVTVSVVDTHAPTASDITTSQAWTTTKTVRASCTETGSGAVQIAFNNPSDYKPATQSGTTYYRDWVVTGDVTGALPTMVYYKDKAGNVTSKKLTIYNLDNTPPTVKEVNALDKPSTKAAKGYEGWNCVFNANDVNKTINKEGSGIIGWQITKDDTPPTTWQSISTIPIYHSGKYYFWVKDRVGHVTLYSKPKVLNPDIVFNNGLDKFYSINNLNYKDQSINSVIYNNTQLRL